MLKYALHILLFIVLALFYLSTGGSCSGLKIHESGHASYSDYACVIHTNISPTEFKKMTDWCTELHGK